MGKLNYLSKYTDDPEKSKKKKKKKKQSKQQRDDDVRLADDDDLVGLLSDQQQDEQDDDDDDDPVVVDLQVETTVSEKRFPKQEWKTVPTREPSSQHGKRHDSDNDDEEEEPPQRRRHDSDIEENDDDGPTRKRRYDSDDEPTRKRRYDSDDDEPPRRKRHVDDDDDEQPKRNDSIHERRTRYDDESERTSHAAGLQKAHEFRQTEKDIQKQRRDEAQAMVDKHGMGETVYRDDLGRKVAEIEKKKLPQLDETEQARLNKGKVQKLQEARFHQEWKHIQESAFARHADDSRLEQARKDVIRQGDPMAVYAARNQIKARVASGKPERPVYKGPSPKPNRFGIGPGYRWDGVDRGNGFEDKVLASKYSSAHKKEEAYRWSTQDM